jgi:probable addiction module antidote protein
MKKAVGVHVLLFSKALGDIARAKGMSQVARDAGLSRESLYKALSASEPRTSTPSLK